MSPALLDTGAPAQTLHMQQHPNPNGQFSSPPPFSFNFSELFSNHYQMPHPMNSSKVVNEKSGFSNSNEIKSDFSFNSPSITLSGSASVPGLTKPRFSKTRRPPGSSNPRSSASTAVPDSGVNVGYNPFRPDSSRLKSVPSGVETRGKAEAFTYGVVRSDSNANLSSGSGGNVDKDVIDEMRELNIRREEGIMNAKASDFDFNSSRMTNLNSQEGLGIRGFVHKGGSDKNLSSGESEVSDELRKLNIGNVGHGESVGKNKDADINFSAYDKVRVGHGIGDNVGGSNGKNVESELPSEFKKLNVKDTPVFDAGGGIFSVNEKKTSAFKSSTKGSDSSAGSSAAVLPEQLKNLNLKDSVNADGVKKNMVESKTSEETRYIFGSSTVTSDSLGMRTEKKLSDKMGNMKIESGWGDSSIQRDRNFSSPGIFMDKQKTGNLREKMFQNVGESIPTAFTCEPLMPVKDASDRQAPTDHPYNDYKLKGNTLSSSFSTPGVHFQSNENLTELPSMNSRKDEFHFTTKQDSTGEPHVVFKTPTSKGNLFSSLNQKPEFSAKRGGVKNTRSKKGRGLLSRQHNPVQVWLGPNHITGESSSQENPVSPGSYSPMDVSPYEETLADNRSRETSVASDDSFHLDESSDLLPTVSNDAMDEDLVSATQRMNISEGDEKCEEKKEGCSKYHFDIGISAEVQQEESISGAETESFKSATEELDSNSDTATSFEDEASLSSNIEKQESDGVQFFSSSSQVTGGTNFIFATSSFAQDHDQASPLARQFRKKNRLKVGTDSPSSTTPSGNVLYASSPVQLPFSGTSSLLSPRHSQIGDSLALQHRGGNEFEVNKKQEIKQVPTSVSAADVAAQKDCEKWRLRGNQSYSKGDFSNAEDWYTRVVNCVSQSETPRSCLRILMLCYSNRAATRMSLGRMREAVEDCILAAVIDPSFLKVQLRAANCYLALGEVEEALQHFKKCLQPGSDVCVDRKIMVEASEGVQKAQKVSEFMNQSAELVHRRTSIDAESALSVISEALRISSHSEKLLEVKAEALFLLRKYEEVIQLCEQSLVFAKMNCLPLGGDVQSANPDSSVLSKRYYFKIWRFNMIFKSYFYLGKLEEALDLLEKQDGLRNGSKALESSIPIAIIQELLCHKAAGNEAFQSGRHAEAIEHYTAALSCNVESCPFAAICFCNRAAAYKALGQITDAIADCSLAIALDKKYMKALSRRATLYEMIRDYGQAARDLQRLVSFLIKQVQEKTNQSGSADLSTSCANDLRQAQLQLSEVEGEARKEIPLNMYLILGIKPSVSASEIKRAYRKAALRHHPDKAGQPLARSDNGEDGLWKEIAEEVHKDADRLFKMIGEAYAVLSNPEKRAQYDLEEEMRAAQKKGNGSGASRTHADVQNYPFERTGSTRHWTEVRKSYWHS